MEREAAAFDEEAVKMAMAEKAAKKEAEEMAEKLGTPKFTGCPGSMARAIERKSVNTDNSAVGGKIESELRQWPVQIKLAPIRAPYFDGANLLIAADCTAYAYGDFHRDFVHNRKVLIGCPKLDEGDYTEKLTEIIRQNDIKSLTIVRMQVPCCGGLEVRSTVSVTLPPNFCTVSSRLSTGDSISVLEVYLKKRWEPHWEL